jgi:hypothetical protein
LAEVNVPHIIRQCNKISQKPENVSRAVAIDTWL